MDTKVLVTFIGKGFTREMYAELGNAVRTDQNNPDGLFFHSAAFDKDGNFYAFDLWESEEKMRSFVNDSLNPALETLSFPPFKIEVYFLADVNAYPEIQKYKRGW